ncbi:hypothetical protein ACTNDN_06810 [Niallia sp. HCP3S3_B10]|uniref:hypothetical protein n=1 Tax=Niallia sp. HCP3S3_B10 TaxID=3438944 RepID=UPI003F8BB56A
MDLELHQKYKKTKFDPETLDMFTDLVSNDTVLKKVFLFIAKNEKDSIVTVGEISEKVQVERKHRVEKNKRYSFVSKDDYIHRKQAEKIVERLLAMSLIYYKAVPPYKHLFLTIRGKQVIQRLYG